MTKHRKPVEFLFQGITDFSLRVALQTLLKEYTEVTKSPKENKMYSQLQPAKMRPRRKARKYLYAIGAVSRHIIQHSKVTWWILADEHV